MGNLSGCTLSQKSAALGQFNRNEIGVLFLVGFDKVFCGLGLDLACPFPILCCQHNRIARVMVERAIV